MSLPKKAEEALQEEVLESTSPGNKFTGTIVDGLLDVWATDEEFVEIELPVMREGKVVSATVKFRVMKSESESNRVRRAAEAWIREQIEEYTSKSMHPVWAEHFSPEPKMLADCFVLAHLAVEDEWKNELPWIILAEKASPVFRHIYSTVMASAVKSDYAERLHAISREKKI